MGAVLVESPLGPAGLVTVYDVIEALASGADPDTVWAGDIARPTPRMVSCEQHPTEVGEEMAAYGLEVVAVVDEDTASGSGVSPRHPGRGAPRRTGPQAPAVVSGVLYGLRCASGTTVTGRSASCTNCWLVLPSTSPG